jgi:hypothetical protein
MSEQRRSRVRMLQEPAICLRRTLLEAFMLLHSPSSKVFLKLPTNTSQLSLVELPVVVEPTSDHGINGFCHVFETVGIVSPVDAPVMDLLIDFLL